MDTARRVLAIVMAVTTPPAIVYWFVVHPFADFWRRRGVKLTYIILLTGMFLSIALLFLWRDRLLGTDFGTRWPLVALGLVLYALSGYIEVRVRKHLTFRMLAGVPEVTGESGVMLDQGIYAHVRHPRYTGFLLAVAGFAFFTNYSGMYVLTLVCIPLIMLVARMEERELYERFGQRYRDYARRVPRFIPRPG